MLIVSATRPSIGRRLRPASVIATFALALGFVPAAAATPPQLVITSPAQGSATNNTAPVFSGEVGPLEVFSSCEISVTLFAGATEHALPQPPEGECNWVIAPAAPLEPGTYTAQASGARRWLEGEEEKEEALLSAPVTFTVDTAAPTPTIASPSPGAKIAGSSLTVSGSAGTARGDLPGVTVEVFARGETAGTPVEAIEAQSHQGSWSGSLAGLAPGEYTLQVQQTDWAGNVGASTPLPITIVPLPPPPPPSASFTWFPQLPGVGEVVTLVSSSTDAYSPLTTFAWRLNQSAAFGVGHSTTTTTFATAGPHVVRLQVTDAAGRSAIASQTITVRHRPATLMQPFPIVRIAGRETHKGVKLTLLTVAAPVSARVTVRIRRAGRHTTSVSRVASLGKRLASEGTVLMSFPRFARALPAGSTLEVRVTKAGQIGKLMRLIPHAGRLPSRQDLCLAPGGRAMRCPST
jgi:hypothetical protein